MRTKIIGIMFFLALFAMRTNSQSLTITSMSWTNASSCTTCDGTATPNVSGGYPPYSYYWYPGGATTATVTGLCPGYYSVFVQDTRGDSTLASVLIGPASISLTMSSTNATCTLNNGTATASASGGTPPFTYLWTPGGATTATVTGLGAGTYSVMVTDAGGCSAWDSVNVFNASSSLYDSVTTTSATCGSNTGTATSHTFGGFTPYTYLWSPGGQTTTNLSGLSSGTYTLTVKDAHGCNFTNVVTVGTTGLILNLSETDVLCTGGNTGSASVSGITGGVAPYTYLWSPGGATTAITSGLSSGTYSVTVMDHNGCSGSGSIYVGQASMVRFDSASFITGSSCSSNNGSAYVQANGGTYPYTYLWSPSGETTATATGLSAGSYTVTVTDLGGCSATTAVVVPSLGPVPTIVTDPDSCNGGSDGFASVTSVSGGITPYTYSWAPVASTSNSISGLTAGNYTVTITDNTGCSSTTSVNIYQPGPLTIVADTIADTGACTGSAYIYIIGGTGPYTYTWSAPVNATLDSLNGESVDSLCAGAYLLCVNDAHGCSSCDSVHIRHAPHPLGIGSIKEDMSGIKVYPDPVSSVLNVATDQLMAGSYSLYVYDMIGRQVLPNNNITINRGETISINVSSLPTGKYMLRISGTSSNKIAPFVVTH